MIINNSPYNAQVNFGVKVPKIIKDVLREAADNSISVEEAARRIGQKIGNKKIPVADFRGVPIPNKASLSSNR